MILAMLRYITYTINGAIELSIDRLQNLATIFKSTHMKAYLRPVMRDRSTPTHACAGRPCQFTISAMEDYYLCKGRLLHAGDRKQIRCGSD